MSDALNSDFSADELAYYKSGGEAPLPGSEATEKPAREEPKPEADPKPEPVVAEPEPDAPEDDAGDDTDGDDAATSEGDRGKRKVNYSAYQRVKAEVAEAKKAVEDARQRFELREREVAAQQARIQERYQMLERAQQEANKPKAEEPRPIPDLNENPLEHVAYLAQEIENLKQEKQKAEEHQRQSAAYQDLVRGYRQDGEMARRVQPHFDGAYEFMLERERSLVQIQHGGRLTVDQVEDIVHQKEIQLAAHARNQNLRPAELIWNQALHYGWRPKEAQAAPQPVNTDAEEAKIDAAVRGQALNKSLSSAGRPGNSTGTMTLERWTNLPDDDARRWKDENPGAFEKIAGGG